MSPFSHRSFAVGAVLSTLLALAAALLLFLHPLVR